MSETIRLVMSQVLRVEPGEITQESSPESIERWDSLKHMQLIMALEDELGIQFPDEVLNALRKLAEEVREEEAAKTPMATKVNADFKKFQKVVGTWGSASEKAYYDILQPKYSFKA